MRSAIGRSASLVAAFVLLLSLSVPSQAGLVITLAPTAGTDLSNVHVGDTLQFFTIGSSDVPGVGEHLTVFPNIHLFADTDTFDIFSGVGLAGWGSSLDTHPNLALWTVQVNAAGAYDLFNGFSDCLGLPDDTSGCAVTNLSATRPADSNHVTFTVFEMPEPSSLGLAGLGLLAALRSSRRKG